MLRKVRYTHRMKKGNIQLVCIICVIILIIIQENSLKVRVLQGNIVLTILNVSDLGVL